jgi:hypothetical protein
MSESKPSVLANTTALLRTLVLGGLVLIVGWWTVYLRGRLHERDLQIADQKERIGALESSLQAKDAEILHLNEEIQERDERIRELEAALRLLKIDHRVARIDVLEQTSEPSDPARTLTRVRFTELDSQGEPVALGRELVLQGKLIYVDALVIKFADEYVERGDALRGASICLFRRAFGEDQKPAEGVPLDAAGARPLVYGGDVLGDPFHAGLWTRFWDYANDPEAARALGVRALHGEAPFVEARAGKSYRLELRASGGLTIVAE